MEDYRRTHDRNDQAKPFRKGPGQFLVDIYLVYRFIIRFFREAFSPPFEFREIIRQCYQMGYRSLSIITLTGFITGMVFTKQSRPSLAEFGATSWLPSLVSIAIVRALAPLIAALITAGKIGSGIGSELGSMNVTEQIDAMEVSGTNPFRFLVVTRVVACTLMQPILMFYAAFVSLMGAYVDVHLNELTSLSAFYQEAFSKISFLDIFASVIRSIVYGFTIGMTGCFLGFRATQGTVGVGRAANTAVVVSMFLIFIEEMIIVQIVNGFR
jgi:phospholipid/cholesterol/gamma-HCH transport system permease protein